MFLNVIKLYVRKRLKKEINIVNDRIISFVLVLKILSKLLEGKNPPEEIIVKAKLKELNALILNKFKIIKMKKVSKV